MKSRILLTTLALSFIVAIVGYGNVHAVSEIIDFELEIELNDNSKYDIEYEVRGTMFEAEYQIPESNTLYGEEAKAMIEPLLTKLELTPNMNKKKLKDQILSLYQLDENNIVDFDLEVKFKDGKKLEIDK